MGTVYDHVSHGIESTLPCMLSSFTSFSVEGLGWTVSTLSKEQMVTVKDGDVAAGCDVTASTPHSDDFMFFFSRMAEIHRTVSQTMTYHMAVLADVLTKAPHKHTDGGRRQQKFFEERTSLTVETALKTEAGGGVADGFGTAVLTPALDKYCRFFSVPFQK